MKHALLVIFCSAISIPSTAIANDSAKTIATLKQVYNVWRHSMVTKNAKNWQAYTSQHSQISVRNRLWSQRVPFPEGVFQVPAAPPSIANLKPISVRVNKNTAKSVYFGKVDFGVGGEPTDNLYVISYLLEPSGWKYDKADFVSLNHLPEVRAQISKGDYKFVESPDFIPNGIVPPKPVAITAPAKYIAKVYVFCPGREVKVVGNGGISNHLFQNDKGAEVLIGGAKDGNNTLSYSIKDIPGGNPKDPMTIRVYLMSEVDGRKPLKPVEYQVENGQRPKTSGTLSFILDAEIARYLKVR